MSNPNSLHYQVTGANSTPPCCTVDLIHCSKCISSFGLNPTCCGLSFCFSHFVCTYNTLTCVIFDLIKCKKLTNFENKKLFPESRQSHSYKYRKCWGDNYMTFQDLGGSGPTPHLPFAPDQSSPMTLMFPVTRSQIRSNLTSKGLL